MTPNEVFKDSRSQITQHLNDSAMNQNICKRIDFNNDDNVVISPGKII